MMAKSKSVKKEEERSPYSLKRRIITLIIWILAVIVLLGGYVLYFKYVGSKTGIALFCPISKYLHVLCPGCGITRALVEMTKLNFAAAFELNQLSVLYVGFIAWYLVAASVRYIQGKKDFFAVGPTWLYVAMLVIMAVFAVVRNII